ncbi:MAG TPA: hypothetical protein VFA90_16870 [Terriglobales bacterium]|nr:hypothetical protein [Terriglobales bacterium]
MMLGAITTANKIPSETSVFEPAMIAGCALAVIAALVAGVGFASHLVLRHIVQTLPLWFGVLLGIRRSRSAAWVSLPCFLFWLALMIMIWLYLLGMPSIVSGHFSPLEIAMTIIVGAASVIGIVAFVCLKSFLSGAKVIGIFIVFAIAQVLCFRLSFLPAIAHR